MSPTPAGPPSVTSSVDIANLALVGHLGGKPFADFTEADSPEGPDAVRILRLLYPNVRDELLVLQPWHFATTRVALATLATAPLYGYTYAYQLPQGGVPALVTDPVPPPYCLRVLDTNLDPTWGNWWGMAGWGPGLWPWPMLGVQGLWQIEGRTLISNEAALSIRYIARVDDVSIYPPSFVAALACLLAARSARALTQNETIVKALREEASTLVSKARSVEGQEGSQLSYISTALTTDVR